MSLNLGNWSLLGLLLRQLEGYSDCFRRHFAMTLQPIVVGEQHLDLKQIMGAIDQQQLVPVLLVSAYLSAVG